LLANTDVKRLLEGISETRDLMVEEGGADT